MNCLPEVIFENNGMNFLKTLKEQHKILQEQIRQNNETRDEIIKKLEEVQNNEINISPKDVREYINNTELSLESIDNILKNYNLLSEKFYEIEKKLVVLAEKAKHNIIEDLQQDLDTIKKDVGELKEFENKIKKENSKYILLINNFFEIINYKVNEKMTFEHIDDNEVNDIEDNLILRVSESEKKVFLPYTKIEIQKFLENYPKDYKNAKDVVEQEFTSHISIYNKRPAFARFREAYSLSRNREMRSAIDSFKYALEIMFKSEINPTIIAAVKSEKQLQDYIECLENNDLKSFKHFDIIFEVTPI